MAVITYCTLGVQQTEPPQLVYQLPGHSQELSLSHTVPLKKWLEEGVVFKFWGDNVDKQRRARDLRSDNKGVMVHMKSHPCT